MNIKRIVVGAYAVNCYIVYTDEKKGFIIDPGGDYDDILKFIKEEDILLEFILLTHGHGDHIGAVKNLINDFNLPLYVCEKEKSLLNDPIINLSKSIPPFKPIQLVADVWLKDEEIIDFHGTKLKIIYTPGHTVGSICIVMDKNIFTGDTLFRMSIGRSDFYTGNYDEIMKSIKKLYTYDDDLRVLPGHGSESVLKFEKEHNPFMKNIKI